MFVKDVVFKVPGTVLLQGQVEPYERGQYDESGHMIPGTRTQQIDDETGSPVWSVPAVILCDDSRPETINIKVISDEAPVVPPMTMLERPQVSATPYVQRGRVAYSIRMGGKHFSNMLAKYQKGAQPVAKPAQSQMSQVTDKLKAAGVKL